MREVTDVTSRAALRAILAVRPDAEVVDDPAIVPDQFASADPAVLSVAEQIEAGPGRAIAVEGREVGFEAFLDGIQRARIPAWIEGVPYVLGTVAAAIRVRRERKLATWEGIAPVVEHRFYLPLAYVRGGSEFPGFPVVDTTAPEDDGQRPNRHPAALMERALQVLQRDRERLEERFAAHWVAAMPGTGAAGGGVLCLDGSLPAAGAVRRSPAIVGIVKSHRTLHADGPGLQMVLSLRRGQRSPVFRIATAGREAVASWYLRIRDPRGRGALWGLVRVECALAEDVAIRADQVSRWILAEGAPLALPDPRWDRMPYGIRDCETFLRAIS